MTFDRLIDRRGTHSTKWDWIETHFGVPSEDGLAMWTADSDYPTAPCVIDAARRLTDRGIFGYSYAFPAYFDAIIWCM